MKITPKDYLDYVDKFVEDPGNCGKVPMTAQEYHNVRKQQNEQQI